ncbi:MAG: DNA-3-methyladenine glycosylase I [Pseudomonadota bacterium]
MAVQAANPLKRCVWPGIDDPEYTRYHDEEWGVPITDGERLFEKLVLESFQSGLSWLTILRKRNNFRKAFMNFDPVKIAAFTPTDVERLMNDAGIVRNRAKIDATINNAKAYLKITQHDDFAWLVWSHVDHRPSINRPKRMEDLPAQTEQSKALSKTLKSRGFSFVGPTTMYALMQSCGLVNDHLVSCHRHVACAKLQTSLVVGTQSAPST